MTAKYRHYSNLAYDQSQQIIENVESWKGFLSTAGRLYKYAFEDQLLIHAQRPDAVACAPLHTWNQAMNRYVKKGSKGIALLDKDGTTGKPRLKYVFDVTDTQGEQKNSQRPFLWALKPEHESLVSQNLSSKYSLSENPLSTHIYNIAQQLSVQYCENNKSAIENSLKHSRNAQQDGDTAFQQALTASAAYAIMSRCGIDPNLHIKAEEYKSISSFNTYESLYTLGKAISAISETVLRDIESTVKNYEQQKAIERAIKHEHDGGNHLHERRGLSNPGHSDTRNAGMARQVRSTSQKLPERPQGRTLRGTDIERHPTHPLPRNQSESGRTTGTANGSTNSEIPTARQPNQSARLDSAHEQPEILSGGNNSQRTDLHLASSTTASPDPTTSLSETLSASSITLTELDSILRDGGNDKNSILRITAHFAKNLPQEDNEAYIRREYLRGQNRRNERPNGKGYQFGENKASVWFDENGIKIGRGTSTHSSHDFVIIGWEQAALRVKQLFDNGHYVNHDVLYEALENENLELANNLLFLYRDPFRGYREAPSEWNIGKGWPDNQDHVAGLLRDKSENGGYNRIVKQLRDDVAALDTDPNAPTRFWQNPHQILRDIEKAGVPSNSFQTVEPTEIRNQKFTRFITDDEIHNYLANGNNIEYGKFRILSHFLNNHTTKERVEFLKNEYGTGGYTWVNGGSSWTEPGKGLKLQRLECEDATLSWDKVAQLIDGYIKNGRYATTTEIDRIPSYERRILGAGIISFYNNLPQDIPRPIAFENSYSAGFWNEARRIGDMLDNPETVSTILASMRPIMENTPKGDRYHKIRKTSFEDLAAFENGTFTLFPNLDTVQTQAISLQPQASQVQLTLDQAHVTPEPKPQPMSETPSEGIPLSRFKFCCPSLFKTRQKSSLK